MSGGIVFRVGAGLFFLPASVAMKVLPVPEMAHVPGAPRELRGIALVDGDMIPIVDVSTAMLNALGAGPGAMLVCKVLGECVGLVGLEILATGRFDVADGAVTYSGEAARPFDVASVIARVREGRWAV